MTDAPPAAECREVSAGYGRVSVLRGTDLSLGDGEVVALLGASGSGKTTLLHTLAGLVRPTHGEIRLAGRVVAAPGRWVPPERREVGLVFQGAALWPHLDVRDTVAYPLRRRGYSRADARREADALLERVGLSALAQRFPAQLSGGEQQRVGLARALARDPALFLFDEPTAHLDPHLRGVVLEEIARRREALGAAAVYATHDASEALAVADRVVVLRSGDVVQAGSPREVYERPLDADVARLTGPVSLLSTLPGGVPVPCAEAGAQAPPGPAERLAAQAVLPTAARWLVRPEWVSFGGDLPGVVDSARYRGSHTDYGVDVAGEFLLVREAGPSRRTPGAQVTLTLHAAWALRPAPCGDA